ncbi:hypothetical protein [Clostridium oryzae]|uniref:50S ribosomal protein L37Ae n=1 Tax=Clostridium oryzae TaxID=1450648 RepID=A0A1V4ICF8_9CLOT|nr:hypothetical protein [Clostridium oryzae]OPJ57315.1 50S ribosomal protein L37Ae [Clostridium oryzae]
MNLRGYINKLAYYFKDSYGFDMLSRVLFITGAILSISHVTAIPGLGLMVYSIWRATSKNRYKRYNELASFQRFTGAIKSKYSRTILSITEAPRYKIFKCPTCGQKLRVPRRQGKIIIQCKKCGNEFKGKS